MKRVILQVVLFVIFAAGAASSFAGQNSGCVTCHTNDAVMKSLFLPPKIAADSGEG